MRLILLLAAVPVAVFAAFFAHQACKYTRMISNIFLSLVYNPPFEPPYRARGEAITILDSSGREIPALFLEKKGSLKVAIFCHESGAGKDSWEKYAYFLPDRGYHVLSVDLARGDDRGNSLAQWPIDEDVEKLLTAIHWARGAVGREAEIVLFGVSNGADIAFEASFGDASVKAVVADGLFSMKEIFRDYIRRWAPILVKPNFFGEKYPPFIVNLFTELGFWYSQKRSGRRFVDVEAGLRRRRRPPLLMIHGEKDEYVLPTHQRFLESLDKNPRSERLTVAAAGHNEAVVTARSEYETKIVSFLDEAGLR